MGLGHHPRLVGRSRREEVGGGSLVPGLRAAGGKNLYLCERGSEAGGRVSTGPGQGGHGPLGLGRDADLHPGP